MTYFLQIRLKKTLAAFLLRLGKRDEHAFNIRKRLDESALGERHTKVRRTQNHDDGRGKTAVGDKGD